MTLWRRFIFDDLSGCDLVRLGCILLVVNVKVGQYAVHRECVDPQRVLI